jgi:hypothetical protein
MAFGLKRNKVEPYPPDVLLVALVGFISKDPTTGLDLIVSDDERVRGNHAAALAHPEFFALESSTLEERTDLWRQRFPGQPLPPRPRRTDS